MSDFNLDTLKQSVSIAEIINADEPLKQTTGKRYLWPAP